MLEKELNSIKTIFDKVEIYVYLPKA